MYVEVREPGTGKLLFRYDPERDIIEVVRRGVKTLVALTEYQSKPPDPLKGQIE